MLYTFDVTEVYKTQITVKADTEMDAVMRLEAAQEDPKESHLIDHWLARGFEGRKHDLVETHEDIEENDWMWDFRASLAMVPEEVEA